MVQSSNDNFLGDTIQKAVGLLEGDLPVSIDLAGHSTFVENERLKHEWEPSHPHTELLLVIEGREIITVNRNPVLVSTPALVFIKPNLPHHERPTRQRNAFRSLWIGFGNSPTISVHATWFDPNRHTMPDFHLTGQRYVPSGRYDLAGAHALLRKGTRNERYYGRNILQNYLIECLTARPKEEQESVAKNAVALAEQFIRDNYTRHIGLADVARNGGYSSDHLSRLFKKERGISPVALITELRMKQAAELLANTNNKILSICIGLGFFSIHHFHRVFRDHFNMTPAQYRKTALIRKKR